MNNWASIYCDVAAAILFLPAPYGMKLKEVNFTLNNKKQYSRESISLVRNGKGQFINVFISNTKCY